MLAWGVHFEKSILYMSCFTEVSGQTSSKYIFLHHQFWWPKYEERVKKENWKCHTYKYSFHLIEDHTFKDDGGVWILWVLVLKSPSFLTANTIHVHIQTNPTILLYNSTTTCYKDQQSQNTMTFYFKTTLSRCLTLYDSEASFSATRATLPYMYSPI